eukprot:COSAG01_NODE_5765_length_4043_cov_3.138804_3_plen_150_part_00
MHQWVESHASAAVRAWGHVSETRAGVGRVLVVTKFEELAGTTTSVDSSDSSDSSGSGSGSGSSDGESSADDPTIDVTARLTKFEKSKKRKSLVLAGTTGVRVCSLPWQSSPSPLPPLSFAAPITLTPSPVIVLCAWGLGSRRGRRCTSG